MSAKKEANTKGGMNPVEILERMSTDMANLVEYYRSRESEHRVKVIEFNESSSTKLKIDKQNAEKIINDAKEEAAKIISNAKLQSTETDIDKAVWIAEKQKVINTFTAGDCIKLDVGGSHFTTSLTTLRRFPDSTIGSMFSGRHELALNKNDEYFMDRDGTHFRHILNFLRDSEHFSVDLSSSHKEELRKEAEYYGLAHLMFPFTPAPELVTVDNSGHQIVITQRADGVWLGMGPFVTTTTPFIVCNHCKSAYVTGHAQYTHHVSILNNFTASRDIVSSQPMCTSTLLCKTCHHF